MIELTFLEEIVPHSFCVGLPTVIPALIVLFEVMKNRIDQYYPNVIFDFVKFCIIWGQ